MGGVCARGIHLGAVDLETDLKPWGWLRSPGEECSQRREESEDGAPGLQGLEVEKRRRIQERRPRRSSQRGRKKTRRI